MIQYCNRNKVLNLFLEDPLKGFKLREISRKIKLGLPSVSTYVKELVKERLILRKEEHGIKLLFANRESQLFKKYKIAHNILVLEQSGLLDELEEKYNYPAINLFGSLANGEDRKESDIDLVVISATKKDIDLKKFEKTLKKEIQVLNFTEKEFLELAKKNKELLNNIINGIVLRGMVKI